jgi:hypothetical protein
MDQVGAVIRQGFRVASGQAFEGHDQRFNEDGGTIRLQIPKFRELGLDIDQYFGGGIDEAYVAATLGCDISPRRMTIVQPEYHFRSMRWTDKFDQRGPGFTKRFPSQPGRDPVRGKKFQGADLHSRSGNKARACPSADDDRGDCAKDRPHQIRRPRDAALFAGSDPDRKPLERFSPKREAGFSALTKFAREIQPPAATTSASISGSSISSHRQGAWNRSPVHMPRMVWLATVSQIPSRSRASAIPTIEKKAKPVRR